MEQIYQDGTYLDKNPLWHVEGSPWKAKQIKKIICKNSLSPKSICEVGCGAGEILLELSRSLECGEEIVFWGYDISPQAYEICSKKQGPNLNFGLLDILNDSEKFFDLIMAIDVFEHVEDYYGFLRKIKDKGEYKIFHVPLSLSAQTVLRGKPLMYEREKVGHIQYFSKDIILATLADIGYEVIDYFYTADSIELPNKSLRTHIAGIPRRLAFSVNQDFAVRLLGGHSLLILAK